MGGGDSEQRVDLGDWWGARRGPATLLTPGEIPALCQPRWLWGNFISGGGTHLEGSITPSQDQIMAAAWESPGWLQITASINHQHLWLLLPDQGVSQWLVSECPVPGGEEAHLVLGSPIQI